MSTQRDSLEPSGCRWCGVRRRKHGRQSSFSPGARSADNPNGMHAWTPPADYQILERMRRRRELEPYRSMRWTTHGEWAYQALGPEWDAAHPDFIGKEWASW